MKRLTILMALALVASSLLLGVVTANEYPVLENQVKNRQAHLGWILKLQEITMEAVVDYIDEISEGEGVSELKKILGEFIEESNEIESFTTHVGLNNYLRELKDITGNFRIEARSQMKEYDGKVVALLVRIGEKIEENQDQLDALKDRYWETRKENMLENFDIRVERALNVIHTLEERGYDVSEAKNKLDEIKALRGELEVALDDRDNLEILDVSIEALELSKELYEIIRNLQVEVTPKRILQHWVNIGGRVVERTGVIIDELKSLGLETENLETIHNEAESNQGEAEAKLEEADFDGTAKALSNLVDSLIELRNAYVDLVFPEGFPDELEDAMDTLGEKLGKIAVNMGESLETL